jgi:CubicO group peptidase (beta-lactamase class C family)
MDPLYELTKLPLPFLSRCRVPWDLDEVEVVGVETDARALDLDPVAVEAVWTAVEGLYHSGVHPAIQLCIRRRGEVVLHRALGHASGNAPEDPPDGPKRLVALDTPINVFSASKAITAMVIHKLDERRVLHLEDRVCDYIPEFGRYGKHHITLRHILSHRAGIPNLPPEALDLDLLNDPERILEILCEAHLTNRPGRALAYHAVSGGFVLAEVVRRATGHDIREVLEREIRDPLGFHWTSYGVPEKDVPVVADNAFTGPPVPPPLSSVLKRALGLGLRDVVELSNDPRFVTGIIPSANIFTNAYELSGFYQCLLDGGELNGVRVFEPATVRHATSEQSIWEIDFTLMAPLRYGLGFMLGNKSIGPFGADNPYAFGHIGLSNTFSWADPEREISVALLTTGKPIISLHAVRLFQFLREVGNAFPKTPRASWSPAAPVGVTEPAESDGPELEPTPQHATTSS